MRILVIGGTGELGHHIANGLAARGHAVTALSLAETVLTHGTHLILDGRGFTLDGRIECVQVDKTDADALERAAVPMAPEVIIDTVPSEESVRIALRTQQVLAFVWRLISARSLPKLLTVFLPQTMQVLPGEMFSP